MLSRLLVQFHADTRGATAIEYALLAGAVAVVIITAVATTGDSIASMLAGIADGF